MAKLRDESPPDWPPRLSTYDPRVWCCVPRFESERAHWLYDSGGAPFGRTTSGKARILPFIQELARTGPLACVCRRSNDD